MIGVLTIHVGVVRRGRAAVAVDCIRVQGGGKVEEHRQGGELHVPSPHDAHVHLEDALHVDADQAREGRLQRKAEHRKHADPLGQRLRVRRRRLRRCRRRHRCRVAHAIADTRAHALAGSFAGRLGCEEQRFEGVGVADLLLIADEGDAAEDLRERSGGGGRAGEGERE